jgi:hypothetical protein
MSVFTLQLIPRDPEYVPPSSTHRTAEQLLLRFVGEAEKVEAGTTEEVTFFHPGMNWMGVRCPFCDAELEDWWKGAMDEAFLSRFTELGVTVPCCQCPTSLNDLKYVWDAGFSRFFLKARYPKRSKLSATELAEIEALLASPLKQVFCLM